MVSRKFATAMHLGVALLSFMCLGSSAKAANPETPTAIAQDHEISAEKFVNQRLQVWQDRLNLKDWNIKIQMTRADKLEPKTLGNINWDADVKSAKIAVLSTYDYKLPYRDMLADMEFTVVHELVHLELSSLPRSEASRRVEERAVNEIASALLKLAKR
jgi:hypothetical protein